MSSLATILIVTCLNGGPQNQETSKTVYLEHYGFFNKKRYASVITKESLKGAPSWDPSSDRLPIRPDKLIESADKEAKGKLQHFESWERQQLRLVNVHGSIWLGEIEYINRPKHSDLVITRVRIYVRCDGAAIPLQVEDQQP